MLSFFVAIMRLIYRYLNKNDHSWNAAIGNTLYLKTLDLHVSQVKIQCFLLTGHLYFCHRWHSTKNNTKNAIIHHMKQSWWNCGLNCLNTVSGAVTSNCIPQILWDVIASSYPWYLLLVHKYSINTLRPRQMDAISQTTFSNAFSWTKMFEFRLKFHWSLFPRVQLTIF